MNFSWSHAIALQKLSNERGSYNNNNNNNNNISLFKIGFLQVIFHKNILICNKLFRPIIKTNIEKIIKNFYL